MSDDKPIRVNTDGETFAKVRVDGAVTAAVDVVDEDQVKVRVCDPQHPEESLELYFVDRVEDDSEDGGDA